MRVVCAPDSFKGSLTALQAAEAMQRGVRRIHPDAELDLCPVADGGEGTVRALVHATGGARRTTEVSGPQGTAIEAEWGWLGNENATAVIEMAAASGLTLLHDRNRDPTRTSTFGTGELIRAALDAGARKILLGLGGSATNDGGCGAAQALGVAFFDANDAKLDLPITGGDLSRIHRIDATGRDPRLASAEFWVCRDVDNPLTGPDGAAAIYGPQKGANADQVATLDAGLASLGALWRDQLGVDVLATPGAGAAGGMGGGVVAMLGGRSRSGIELVLDTIDFRRRIEAATLCLTGEGRLDGQSLRGKACAGVARTAREVGVPVLGFFGTIAPDAPAPDAIGMRACHAIAEGIPLEEAIRQAATLLEQAVQAALTP